MKFLLVIPALMLFLSNVPFVHKMDMKEMMAAMKESGFCKKKDAGPGSCSAEEKAPVQMESCQGTQVETVPQKQPSCDGSDETPGTADESQEQSSNSSSALEQEPCSVPETENCGMQDATCVCIYCFQYAAPDQVAAKLQFGLAGKDNALAGYLQQHWKDPHLTAPWQPPDMV